MITDYIDVISTDNIENEKIKFNLWKEGWDNLETFDCHGLDWKNLKWKKVRFLTDENGTEIGLINNKVGGIYMIVCETNVHFLHKYILYIGRAHITQNQNLRKRCKEYYNTYLKYKNSNLGEIRITTRPKVNMLLHIYAPYLCIYYCELSDNKIIDALEQTLIALIIPPCNKELPGKLNKAVSAAF
ncbi:hypothetical protein NMU03_00115 [Allocoprobacillus halotolerans]|uniref:GIY-YIG domain-containing protein n=1 Tax=Allocoprobacillus halotolerans TaxID=2944914 RepID=A0ABY5I2U6_9FIRM|nr:hypothetical protein [Allocoprobacillus halotolerans]UTY39280.1 hypothetical protein NMU03_00115 [Allocoprobacillus halotolerans]